MLAAVLRSAIGEIAPMLPVRLATAMCAVFFNQQGAGATVQKIVVAMLPLLRKMDGSLRLVAARLCAMLKATVTDEAETIAAVWEPLLLPKAKSKNAKLDRARAGFCTMMLEYPELLFYTDLSGQRTSGAGHDAFVATFSSPAAGQGALTAPSLPRRRRTPSARMRLASGGGDDERDKTVAGMLRKRSDWLGRWDDRYFVLKPADLVLKYYANADETKTAKGNYYFDAVRCRVRHPRAVPPV